MVVKLEEEKAPECPNGDNCACSLGTRHFWMQAFTEERERAERAEADLANCKDEL